MAYIPLEIVRELLHGSSNMEGALAYFRQIVTHDRALAQQLLYAFRLLEQNSLELLQVQSLFFQAITDLFCQYGQPQYAPHLSKSHPGDIRRACEFIDAMAPTHISLNDIANVVGMSRFHFLRIFKSATGFSPYAYLIQRRVELARTLIENGSSLAQAALEAGFSDQSHMTRRFKATYGVTPGQYQQALERNSNIVQDNS
jgi:AraC-like DNA-binding protein